MNPTNKVEYTLSQMQQKSLGDIKVLMVEDDQLIREMVIMKLMSHGCIPYETGDGAEVISLIKQYNPHILILDLMLPGMTGEEILEHIKSNPDTAQLPVIIFTNKTEPANLEKTKSLGADRYFIKASTDLNDLVASIKELATK